MSDLMIGGWRGRKPRPLGESDRYKHVPIYKTSMDLTVYLEQVVRKFSRYHKYTLGSDLREQSRVGEHDYPGPLSAGEGTGLVELRERLKSLLVLLRIGQEVRRRFSLLCPMGALVVTSPQAVCVPVR